MIRRLLTGVKDRLVYVVVGSLLAGLTAGQVVADTSPLKMAVVPILFLMIYPVS